MTRRASTPQALLVTLALASCAQTASPVGVEGPKGSCASCKGSSGSHSGGTTRSGSSGSTTGGTSGAGSSAGSSSVSGSGSSSGGTVADAGSLQCPPGTLVDTTYIFDLTGALSLQGTVPVVGATVTELGSNLVPVAGVGTSAVSDQQGRVQLCFSYDVPFTIEVQANSTPTTYVEELVVLPPSEDGGTMDAGAGSIFGAGIVLISDEVLQALDVLLPGGITNTDAFIIAQVTSFDPADCPTTSGWSFDLILPDGGTLPDGGNQIPFVPAYFNSLGVPQLGLTATNKGGTAVLFNIDPSVAGNTGFLLVTNPDAGACPLVQGQVRATGRVTLENSTVTYAPSFTR